MGAGASQLHSLPDRCTREDVGAVAGALFDQNWFDSHVDAATSTVSKMDLVNEARARGIMSPSQVALHNLNQWKKVRRSLLGTWEATPGHEQLLLDSSIQEIRKMKPLQPIDPVTGKEEFDGSFRQQSLGPTAHVVMSCDEHREIAARFLGPFAATVRRALKDAGLPTDPYDAATDTGTLLLPSTLKSPVRIAAKARNEYQLRNPGPAVAWIMDVVRGAVILDSPGDVALLIGSLVAMPGVDILRLKNRFRHALFHGYRDILINFRLILDDGLSHHTCELQVHLRSLFSTGVRLQCHETFEYFRDHFHGNLKSVTERLQCLIDAEEEGRNDGDYSSCGELVNAMLATALPVERARSLALLMHDLGELELEVRLRQYIVDAIRGERGSTTAPDLPNALNDLAWGHYVANLDLDKALSAFREAINLVRLLEGEAARKTEARATEGMGLTLDKSSADKKVKEEALEFLECSIRLYKAIEGPEGRLFALAVANKAMVIMKLGRLNEAEGLYTRALEIQRRVADNERDIARTLNNQGASFLASGELEKAWESFNSALLLRIKVYGPENRNVAMTYANLAHVDENLGDLEAAVESLKTVVTIKKTVFGTKHREVARGLEECASVLISMGKRPDEKTLTRDSTRCLVEALEMCEEALQIREGATLDPMDPALTEARQRIANLSRDVAGLPRQEESHRVLLARRNSSVKRGNILQFAESSVLFCDIVEFSTWCTDEEKVGELLPMWFETMQSLVDKCPGVRQVRTTGDTFMAWSGAERTVDPNHADEMMRFAMLVLEICVPAMQSKWGDGFAVRVGVNSGDTWLGQLRGVDSNFELYGDTVNTAWRMQELAPHAAIMLSRDTLDSMQCLKDVTGLKGLLEDRNVLVKGKGEMDVFVMRKPFEEERFGGILNALEAFLRQKRGVLENLHSMVQDTQEETSKSTGGFPCDDEPSEQPEPNNKKEEQLFQKAIENVDGCVNGNALVLMGDGRAKAAKDVVVGDSVATDGGDTVVVEAHVMQRAAPRSLVKIGNLFISKSHRIQSVGGIWIKPEQHTRAQVVRVSMELHNFVTEGESRCVIIEGIVCSTYGQFCYPSHDWMKPHHRLWGSRTIVELMKFHPEWPNITLGAADPFLQLLKRKDFAVNAECLWAWMQHVADAEHGKGWSAPMFCTSQF